MLSTILSQNLLPGLYVQSVASERNQCISRQRHRGIYVDECSDFDLPKDEVCSTPQCVLGEEMRNI